MVKLRNTNRFVSIFNGQGKLLANGACIEDTYTKDLAPQHGMAKVYSGITNQRVRSVASKEGTVSVDFTIRMMWQDPGIKTKPSDEDMKKGGMVLSNDAINHIWIPDLYILNQKSFESKDHWTFLKDAQILTTPPQITLDENKSNKTAPTVEITYDIKCTVYCKFHHSSYPMDNQTCLVKMGSISHGAVFVLDIRLEHSKRSTMQITSDFIMVMTLFDQKTGHGKNKIGIKIEMDRKLSSFMLQYYIPCIAIVLISQLSYVIPVTAIPGRVSLLLTLFLTLVNLFIHQMVSACYGKILDFL